MHDDKRAAVVDTVAVQVQVRLRVPSRVARELEALLRNRVPVKCDMASPKPEWKHLATGSLVDVRTLMSGE
jgi:hypothetical protein